MLIHKKIRYRLVYNRARRLNRRGEGLIQIELQQGDRRRYLSTHVYVFPENWRNGQIVGTPHDSSSNYSLWQMIREIEQIELDFLVRGIHVTLPSLIDAVKTKVTPSVRLRDFTLSMLAGSKRKESTKATYQTLLNDIDRFRHNTYLKDIDYQWVLAYEHYLRESKLEQNTRVCRLRLLHAIVNEALKHDLLSQNPFKRMKFEKLVVKKGYVSLRQLHSLEAMELSGKTDLARDMFLVGCYTGLRFSDVVTLKQSDIKDGWVSKKTIKTGASVEIPTSLFDGRMEQIVAKYDGNIENLTCHHIGNSEVNRLLKPLFTKLKMSDSITFHSSRHTFATLLSLWGVSLEIVQKMLGHSSATMTAIYDEARHDNRKELLEGLKCVLKKKQ